MYRQVSFLGTFSFLILIAFVSLAYGSTSEKDVIGKWKAVKMTGPEDAGLAHGEIEFFSDKTYMSTFDDPGQWTILDDGRIKIQNPLKIMLATVKEKQMIIDFPKSWGNRVLVLEKKIPIEEAQYKTAIIGTWQTNISNRILTETFNKDKSYILKIEIIEPGKSRKTDTVKVPYKFIDSQKIEIGSGSINVIKKLTSDELVMYNEQRGTDIIYKRISK